jgi:hypothetical protein
MALPTDETLPADQVGLSLLTARLVSGLKHPVLKMTKTAIPAITKRALILLCEIDFKKPPILFLVSNSYDGQEDSFRQNTPDSKQLPQLIVNQ